MNIEHSSLFAHSESAPVVDRAIRHILLQDFHVEIPASMPLEDVALNGNFLHLTSLEFLKVLMTLEEDLNINLGDELFMGARLVTVGDLRDFVIRVCTPKND